MTLWSERKLIEKIKQATPVSDPGVLQSIGDDCCHLAPHSSLLISTDTLVDSVHFDTSFHLPYLLGRKSIAVNLSDIAAMGGQPRYVLLSLCLPESLEWEWICDWVNGAVSMLQEHSVFLVGGDTVKGSELVITVTVIGAPVAAEAIYRSDACTGDSIWVSGILGAAGAGLALLKFQKKSEQPQDYSEWQTLLDAHLNPDPRVALGIDLAKSGCVTALQDISDGLATDLAHLCHASSVSASINYDLLPCPEGLKSAADFLEMRIEDLILRAGEDYELIFTVDSQKELQFRRFIGGTSHRVTKIGTICSGQGVFLRKNGSSCEIGYSGYEH